MRILILSKYYKKYLNYFFAHKQIEENSSYESLNSKLIEDRYFWSNYFKKELPVYGYQVEQIVIDAKPLQFLWAKQYGRNISKDNWYFDILLQQIAYYKPEILFIQDWSKELGGEFIKLVKAKFPFVNMFVGYCGEGHPSPDYFKYHDFVISCAKDNIDYYRKKDLIAYHIYHAFYPDILKQLGPQPEKTEDVAFIGRIVASSSAHKERAKFLYKLAKSIPLTLHGEVTKVKDYTEYHAFIKFIYGHLGFFCENLNKIGFLSRNRFVRSCKRFQEHRVLFEATSLLKEKMKEPSYGLSMFNLIRKFKILLNFHISSQVAANLRLFEVTGMGTCLVTDWKKNIKELFEPDYEVVTYKNFDEAVDKINYLKKNPDIIKTIAIAGQKRTLRDHTYKNRAADLHNIFQDYLKKYYRT